MDVMNDYVNAQIRTATGLCLRQLGFSQTNTSCVDVLTDVMRLYLYRLVRLIRLFSEHGCKGKPSIQAVELAFKKMKININELYEYMRQVRSLEQYETIPKFPVPYSKPKHNTGIKSVNKEVEEIFTPVHGTCKFKTPMMTPLPEFSEATAFSVFFTKPSAVTARPFVSNIFKFRLESFNGLFDKSLHAISLLGVQKNKAAASFIRLCQKHNQRRKVGSAPNVNVHQKLQNVQLQII
ncbi:bromodomain associated [Dictyocaulus viviparus]|uniref:Bromodomain associated n=1 Tax=Dictyocaulus viviparus TaxID=29172 RepID=A0A0D8XMX3_DICVI|nr:bromodomain associated [Dictyocaulus viviparus]